MSTSTHSVKVQLENLDKASVTAKLGQTATTTGEQLLKARQQGSKFGQDIVSGRHFLSLRDMM